MINKQLELTEQQTKCHYNTLTTHNNCPIKNYCLFNTKRNELEQNIQNIKIIYYTKKKELNKLILTGKGTTNLHQLNKSIKNIEKDLKRLIEYREKIMREGESEYGYK